MIFRACFDNFDFSKIAKYGESDIERILATEGMIRSPRKVAAIINNAKCYQKVREEFGSFCNYLWAPMPRLALAHITQSAEIT